MRLLEAVVDLVGFVRRVAARTRQIGLARAAGSLAFTTLLGLVPLATVALEFVARFPVFHRWLDTLETFLLRHMLPDTAYAVVHTHIREFTEKAAGLTGISIMFIVFTAAMLIGTVEREINALWGVTRARPLVRRLFIYAVGTTVGPVLVGASISVSTWLVTQSLDAVPLHGALSPIVVPLLPLVFSTLALALLYEIVPARHVPWRHAFAAGILAALAFEGAKQGFAFYLTHVPTYELVYGALAALPVFLIWIYVCWLIVLAGAAITATLTLPPDAAPRRGMNARRS
ncbi:MAG: YihY family inner membrane protein [Betaproteobacteria bacterium]